MNELKIYFCDICGITTGCREELDDGQAITRLCKICSKNCVAKLNDYIKIHSSSTCEKCRSKNYDD